MVSSDRRPNPQEVPPRIPAEESADARRDQLMADIERERPRQTVSRSALVGEPPGVFDEIEENRVVSVVFGVYCEATDARAEHDPADDNSKE